MKSFFTPLAAAAGLLVTGGALAQSSPYYIGASQGFTRDSNVTRAADGVNKKGDTISATGIRAGIDQSFGRQRLNADLSANRNQYSSQKTFNNTDYDASGSLNWETIERLSGVLSLSSRESLYRNTDRGTAALNKITLRNDSASLQARLGMATELSFDAGLSGSRSSYSDPSLASNNLRNSNLRQTSVNAGVRWSPVDIWSVRLGLRHTDGRYVNINDDIKRDDLDLSGNFNLSGASDLSARLSYTKTKHSLLGTRDSRGWTGLVAWAWKPTGRLRFDTSLVRDNDVGAQDINFAGLGTQSFGDAKRSTTLSTRAAWELTSKINANAGISLTRRALDSVFSGGAPANNTDRTTAVNLGLSYQVLRNIDLGCTVSREDRRTSSGTLAGTYPYDVTVYGCSGQIYLR